MSWYTDVRDAITDAIKAGDTTCPVDNIHNRRRVPKRSDTKKLRELFGDKDETGDIYHGWTFTREGSPEETTTAESDSSPVLTQVESWHIKGLYTFRDDLNPTEETFQEIVDSVRAKLRSHASILQLVNDHQIYIDATSIDQIGLFEIAGDSLCHYADLTLRLRHEEYNPQ